jgi:hypothetical protein
MFLLLVARLLPWIPYKIELPILCPSTCSLRARLRPGFRLGESSSSERRAHAPEGGPTGPEAGRTEFSYFRATLSTHSKPRRAFINSVWGSPSVAVHFSQVVMVTNYRIFINWANISSVVVMTLVLA